jgi:hypothetical protein
MATQRWRSTRLPCRPCRWHDVRFRCWLKAKGWGKRKAVGYADLTWHPKIRSEKRVIGCKHFGLGNQGLKRWWVAVNIFGFEGKNLLASFCKLCKLDSYNDGE